MGFNEPRSFRFTLLNVCQFLCHKTKSSLRLGVFARDMFLVLSALELYGGPAPTAFDSHQVSQNLSPGPPTGTIRLSHDSLRECLHPDLSLHPLTTLAEMDVSQLGEGRPGQTGKHLPVVRTTAFVHGWSMLLVPGSVSSQDLCTPGKDHSQCPKKKLGLKAVFMRFYCGREMRREGEMWSRLTAKPPFVVLKWF